MSKGQAKVSSNGQSVTLNFVPVCGNVAGSGFTVQASSTTSKDWLLLVYSTQSGQGPTVSGNLRGQGFSLVPGATGTIGTDRLSGTFSGTDVISGNDFSGSFACK